MFLFMVSGNCRQKSHASLAHNRYSNLTIVTQPNFVALVTSNGNPTLRFGLLTNYTPGHIN